MKYHFRAEKVRILCVKIIFSGKLIHFLLEMCVQRLALNTEVIVASENVLLQNMRRMGRDK